MNVKATILLQPQAHYAHTTLMNMINLPHPGTHAPSHPSDLVVITKWLCFQEVVVTTVILILLANSQTVQNQEIVLYLQVYNVNFGLPQAPNKIAFVEEMPGRRSLAPVQRNIKVDRNSLVNKSQECLTPPQDTP